jgi:hypothetical protein
MRVGPGQPKEFQLVPLGALPDCRSLAVLIVGPKTVLLNKSFAARHQQFARKVPPRFSELCGTATGLFK